MPGSSLPRPDPFLVKHLERNLTRLLKVIAKASRDDIRIADRAELDLPGLILAAVPPVMVAIRDTVKGFASPERTLLQFRVVTALLRGPSTITELAALTGASAAAGLAAINSVGNLGGFIAQNAIPWIRDSTGSNTTPMLFLAACLVVGALMTFLVMSVIRRHGVREIKVAEAAL